MAEAVTHALMANAIRVLAMDAVQKANSGHPGLPMGEADVATVLFTRHLKFDASAPHWPDRDRFVLSAGHGSMLLYSLLYLLGYEGMTIDELKRFRQLGSKTAGHPEYGHAAGIETTTGPLGQGIANAVGMAIAERIMNAQFGDDLVDHRTYVIASDGDLMEGISQEAIALAGHLKLNRLIVIFDDNSITIDGPIALSDSTDQVKRFEASGWWAMRIDGHDPDAIDRALSEAKNSDRPVLIAAKTVIGKGAPKKAGTAGAHGSPLGPEEIAGARAAFGWTYAPFELPDDIVGAWQLAGRRSHDVRAEWEKRLAATAGDIRAEFERRFSGVVTPALDEAIEKLKRGYVEKPQSVATRKASELALEEINAVLPETIGGSADLTPSNNTKTKGSRRYRPRQFRWPVSPLRHPRARHGGGHERHGAAWRDHPLRRHLPDLFRLLPAGDTPGGADAAARHLRDDARLRSASAKTGRRISRSSSSRRFAPSRTFPSTGQPTSWRPPSAGSLRCTIAKAPA